MIELPPYGLRAYALLYSRRGSQEPFNQSELEWIVSPSMKKKIFSLLLRSGWLVKVGRTEYRCVSPEQAIKGLLEYRVPEVLKKTSLPYALTGASAVELWSDYSYVQRGMERSPYFIKVLRRDLAKWQNFLNKESIQNYIGAGSTVGEFIILKPVKKLKFIEKSGLKVEPLNETIKESEGNYLFDYALQYIKNKHGV